MPMKQEHIDMEIKVDNIRKGEKRKGKQNNEFDLHVNMYHIIFTVWNSEKQQKGPT